MNVKSEPVSGKLDSNGEIDDSNSGRDQKICGNIDKSSMWTENVVTRPHDLQVVNTTDQDGNSEGGQKIEQNTSSTPDDVSYNRKRVRERSRKLTRLLQDHEKMLRRTFNQGMKQINKCKSLSNFIEEKYVLIVSNFPKFWSCIDIKHYIEAQSDSKIDKIQVVENCGLYEVVHLTFYTFDEAKQVIDKLYDNEVEGIKLCFDLKVVKDESGNISDTTTKPDSLQWRPDLDIWDIDPLGLYGLKPQFLESLGIEPPIDKWVQVSNFRCEKSELKEVLELAGHVLMCSIVNFNSRRANVMYSHPLEAVQAISMLNGQTFYGLTLKLEMDRCPKDTVILPKGLTSIGTGLGDRGKPIRNIVSNYKRYVKGASCSINQLLFTEMDNNRKCVKKLDKTRKPEKSKGKLTKFGPVSVQTKNVTELFNNEKDITDRIEVNQADFSTPVNADKIFPTAGTSNHECSSASDMLHGIKGNVSPGGARFASSSSVAGMATTGNSVSPVEPNFGVCIPGRNCSPQNLQPPAFRPGPVQVGSMAAPSNVSFIQPGLVSGLGCSARPVAPSTGLNLGTFSVQMSNLPRTTTFRLLYDKLSTCGQVLSLKFTTPGCAVASYASQEQAERCTHRFNMLNVDGCVINAALM